MIQSIVISQATVPMAEKFSHSTAERSSTSSVLVVLRAGAVYGWGEGAPRPYVTGETMQSVVDSLSQVSLESLNELIDFGSLNSGIATLHGLPTIKTAGGAALGPAAQSALELALFDLLCRAHRRPGADALRTLPTAAQSLYPAPRTVPVSYVLDLSTDVDRAMSRLGGETVSALKHVKVKASGNVAESVDRVRQVRYATGPSTRISVDVNGVWERDAAVEAASALLPLRVDWLEEPVAARDWESMAAIRQIGMPVMLDESFSSREDLISAVAEGAADYVNLRVSKCGGILPTLSLLAEARERGVAAQLGVHVGEIGPLWSAARLIACSVKGLVAVEAGKHDSWFPSPLTVPPNRVDRNKYVVRPLRGFGLGIRPSSTLTGWARNYELTGV